ncbi:MAG: hypothetical protein IT175_17845 [Acidobacteria bacterium]|nr:hypothetical protein [Acidobacteriota bacterium]
MNRRRALVFSLVVMAGLASAPVARAAITMERLRDYVLKAGAKIESSEGSLLVTSMATGGPKVEIRVLNDAARHRIGLYAYGFGNATGATSTEALLDYLLVANSELGTGGFFVDKDRDIGYKLLLDTRDPLSAQTFQIKYLAMVAVIRERRPAILKLVGKGPQREKPVDEAPADTEEPAPQTELADPPAQNPPRTRRR